MTDFTSLNQEVRNVYAKTLTAMKSAHIKTYFEMHSKVKETNDGISLPPLFASFHPCPLKLTALELCKTPISQDDFPEIFNGLEADFKQLQKSYNQLTDKEQQQVIDSLVEGDGLCFNAFYDELSAFAEKISKRSCFPKTTLLKAFQTDVSEIKELVDFFSKEIKKSSGSENSVRVNGSPLESLLLRVLFSMLKSPELPSLDTLILDSYFSELNKLKVKYDALDRYSQNLLVEDSKLGGFFFEHPPQAGHILVETKKTIEHVVLRMKDVFPTSNAFLSLLHSKL